MQFLKLNLGLLVACLLITASCKKEEAVSTTNNSTNTDVLKSYTKIGETYIIGSAAKAVVYSPTPLIAGYTKFYTVLFDSITNEPLADGHLKINPVMDMSMMQHSAPLEDSETSEPADKIWTSQVIFSMSGTWKLNLSFHNHKNNLEGDGSILVAVDAPSYPLVKSITLVNDDSTSVLITLVKPSAPQIGLNDIEFTIHEKLSMMEFPPTDKYTLEINPQMPSMGHGSPNNVNPVYTNKGHYVGKVNLTMTGLWRVNLTIKKNGIVMDDSIYFDLSF